MDTLPDYLRRGLTVVSIGLNPSIPSVRHGFYFANPRNRFWRALNESELVAEHLHPGLSAQEWLFAKCGIGFTDVVKRPTPGAAALRAADFRADSPILRDKILRYAPEIAWFHGKVAYQHYARYTGNKLAHVEWGLQPLLIGQSKIFVTPNPSPANAAFSLSILVDWYNELHKLVQSVSRSG
jgi:TDG/mug DNA glycosylase family protein